MKFTAPKDLQRRAMKTARAVIVRNSARVIEHNAARACVSIERYAATKVLPSVVDDVDATMFVLSAVAEFARQDAQKGGAG